VRGSEEICEPGRIRHTIDETKGSSGLGFSIKSYIAMMTIC